MKYRFTDSELKKILKNIVIVVDTREQINQHILDYFDDKKKKYIVQKLDQGDYSAYIESNEETKPLGVSRNWYFSDQIVVERKASVDEIIGNFVDRDRLENEFLRLDKYETKTIFLIEDKNGYEKILKGKYRSQYRPVSAIGTMETFIARYGLNLQFIDKQYSGFKIYQTLYYHIREILKNKGYIEEQRPV
ncbi:ERCC4 domain-containing protein [Clostridium brassicae]|uniref:ERCC4 domain-containing protein n=1 Tax=Clostridium brassicae TaxID=2999072 RepID=A0ABT4DCH9_9CLOT|nr:ERCC4 domain-containing protein [Clostridium brassicae]MCY6958846.1 ERCC4 domain-containing protein [Clostridium brassicae]